MKYMGSKSRIAKNILPIILKDRKDGQFYVEPFVGGANMIDKVDGNRIGSDCNEYLIALLKALSKGWQPPIEVTRDFFFEVKGDKEAYSKELVGYLGFQLTFGCEWWGSFRRDNTGKRKYDLEAYNNVVKQQPNLTGIDFRLGDYDCLRIPPESIIYCDPPYEGVRKYVGNRSFDSAQFWCWCRGKIKQGHSVFVSEYNAPDDFVCVWEKQIPSNGNNSIKAGQGLKATEKLFVHESQVLGNDTI